MQERNDEMEEIKTAIAMVNGDYYEQTLVSQDLDLNHRSPKPEKLLRVLCMGCGGTLSDWDVSHHWAYCYSCRKVLYPESVIGSSEGQRSTNHHFRRNRSDTTSWNGNRRNWHRDGGGVF